MRTMLQSQKCTYLEQVILKVIHSNGAVLPKIGEKGPDVKSENFCNIKTQKVTSVGFFESAPRASG